MNMRLLMMSLATVALCACSAAQYRWQPGEGVSDSLEQVTKSCETLATKHAVEHDTKYYGEPFFYSDFGFYGHHHHGLFGYGFGVDPFFDNRDRYFKVCMEAKGWQRVKVEPEDSATNTGGY